MREELPPLRSPSGVDGDDDAAWADGPCSPTAAEVKDAVTKQRSTRASVASVAEVDMTDEMRAMMEEEALKHTMDPHLVMVAAERQIMEAALAAARADSRREQVAMKFITSLSRKRNSAMAPQDTHITELLSFVPKVLERCISHGLVSVDQWRVLLESPVKSWYDPVLSRFPAAVVFADASGFTKLTETLAKLPNGAEQIGKTLNDFFGPLIAIVHKHGGDIIKFSGDALTIIWAAEEPAPPRVDPNFSPRGSMLGGITVNDMDVLGSGANEDPLQAKRKAMEAATNCCLQIQQEIHLFGKTPVPGCDLTMHIGVGFADVALLQVGGLLGRWEFCIAGKALDQISIAEPLAHSGETCFSPEAVALASHCFDFEPVASPPGVPGGFAKLLGPKSGRLDVVDPLPWWPSEEELPNVSTKLIKRFIPTSVGICLASTLDAKKVAYPEEMRRVSVIFLSIAGLDPFDDGGSGGGDPSAMSGGRMSQLLMRLFQRSVYALEGSVNKFLVDDKGVLLLIVFGLPPLIHLADDPIRAVLCAMRLCDTLADEGLEGHVGVATGHCWCGVVGGSTRKEYTVLGDVVNLSARLMGKAAVNGVLVDSTTEEMASRVLQFEDAGELTMKGKAKPVQAFRFMGLRRGLCTPAFEAQHSELLSWHGWPAHPGLMHALDGFKHRSGVLFITGPGGAGKTELADLTEAWTKGRGWKLLTGQNMDPTGIFSVPRLSLQEAFRELMRFASKDPFWRSYAQDLIRESLGKEPQKTQQQREEDYGATPCPFSRRRSEAARRLIAEAPRHSELYWMLIAMMRSRQDNVSSKLQSWAPLLSMVVTDLAFGPGMVSAMAERDEQHAKHNRFAEVVAAVMDGFTHHLEPGVGCMILLHIRRSSAFYQSRDEKESAAIRALAELCMQRRKAAVDGHESNPVVLCVVSRESVLKDGAVMRMAEQCKGLVPAEDLSVEQTQAFLEHLVRLVNDEDVPHREVLAKYAFEVSGGNPRGVLTVVTELEERGLIQRTASGAYSLSDECGDAQGLRQSIPLPQSLVGMAFSSFETLSPQEQTVLKVASTSNTEFGLHELHNCLKQMTFQELRTICERLADPKARTLRRVNPGDANQVSPDNHKYRFYSMVLRHVTSTLVLETQRTELRRLTSMGVKLNSAEMAKLQKLGGRMSALSERTNSIEEEEDEDESP